MVNFPAAVCSSHDSTATFRSCERLPQVESRIADGKKPPQNETQHHFDFDGDPDSSSMRFIAAIGLEGGWAWCEVIRGRRVGQNISQGLT